jgi:hypothetical protein
MPDNSAEQVPFLVRRFRRSLQLPIMPPGRSPGAPEDIPNEPVDCISRNVESVAPSSWIPQGPKLFYPIFARPPPRLLNSPHLLLLRIGK